MTASFEDIGSIPDVIQRAEPVAESGIDPTWLGNSLSAIERQEYMPVVVDSGIRVYNRAHGFGALFTDSVVIIACVKGQATAWEWRWQPVSFGRSRRECDLHSVSPEIIENRVEYRRGSVTEWYVNTRTGLEQGFTIASPPDGGTVATEKFGEYYVKNYNVQRTRLPQISFSTRDVGSHNASALWDFLSNVDISDKLTITTNHKWGGGLSSVEYYVEGIHETHTPMNTRTDEVRMTIDLSPRSFFGTSVWE